MSRPIHDTERCKLFEDISSLIWNRIIRAHDVNVDLKEIGLTADILVEIQQYNKNKVPNFDVYAKPGWDEDTYGSDMDIYVETTPNKYRWFALQAKVLKRNNRYTTLRDTSNGIMQWDKLMTLEAVSGCKSYYLLYNGRESYKDFNHDSCDRKFTPNQFGCSLVETFDIIQFAQRKNKGKTRYINPSFEDIHPDYANPWRILVCCYLEKNIERYDLEEIIESNPTLKKVSFDNSEPDEKEDKKLDSNNDEETTVAIVENNRINRALREANWNPNLRFIVHRTDNLD